MRWKLQDRSYLVLTEQGDIRRNRKHLVKLSGQTPRPRQQNPREIELETRATRGLCVPRWLWQETDDDPRSESIHSSEDEGEEARSQEEKTEDSRDSQGEISEM